MPASALLLVFAGTLAVVFGAAGIAKLSDLSGSREAASSFGVPDRLVELVARGLPLAEIAIAALLLPTATRWWAALASLALLLVFCAAIGRALARGEAPDCHCFGQLHSAPAGWRTLARNGVLAAIAVALVVAGSRDAGPSVTAWATHLGGIGWLVLALSATLVATIAAGGYVVSYLLRSYGRVLLRLDAVEERLRAAGFDFDEPEDMPELGLQPGTPAPDFVLASTDGGSMSLSDLRGSGRPVLLVFTTPTCGPCSHLMPAVARWQHEHGGELTVAVLSHGDPEAIRAEAARHELGNVLLDEGRVAYEAYEAKGTPCAVLIGDDGTIAAWLAAGSDWIESLVQQALAGQGRTPGLPIGTGIPALELSRLDGTHADLREVIEQDTVLLFWNPGCGFCRSLLPDILAWEASPPADAPALVVVSAGERPAVEAEGFASEVLLDPGWSASSALGADGTPMAVLVSADARIATAVVGGGAAVLEVLGAREPVALPRHDA